MENSISFTTKLPSFKILDSDKRIFFVSFSKKEEKIEISVNEKSIFASSYKVDLELKFFQELNKFFRQFDNISELLEFFLSLDNPEEKLKLISEDKFIKLTISLPCVSKNKENSISISIPQLEVKENDLIKKICQQVNKIDALESKIRFLFNCLGKTESDFTLYEYIVNNFQNNLEKSKIIKADDLFLVSKGIQEKLNKKIKDIKLIYRASKDGDRNEFEIKCKGKTNIALFIKSLNNKRFGGFFSKEYNFDNNNNNVNDPCSFLFSLDHQECYYFKDPNNAPAPIIDNKNGFGNKNNFGGFGLQKNFNFNLNNPNQKELFIGIGCLSNKNSYTQQYAYDYNGKTFALNGEKFFQVEDFEVYELNLEKIN